ncbi:PA14 domain-containing protein [Rufibacter psychrotolerans]|uniref:PA14 domain-containing protein n=1 Tax=Rufibacter psychrotolerans TaxID=2812556 RepID=UPI001966F2C6|nr:PA14 domain-containing protein [Rufibacter sp. SYSU D00308]
MKDFTRLILRCRMLSIFVILLGIVAQGRAQTPVADSKGSDFWLTFPGNFGGQSTLTLFITGEVGTTGVVSIPGMGFSTNFSVTPGEITSVVLPTGAQLMASNSIENKGIHVVSQQEVTVYGLNRQQFTTDAFLALPTNILGTEYINLGYKNVNVVNATQLAIVATVNNTSVTITPTEATDGHAMGVPYTITLNQGQTYLLQNTSPAPSDLSGTLISSSQPVAVFGSHGCANIPDGNTVACDYIVEQLPPSSAWGKAFVTIPLATRRGGDTFRFLASEGNTVVSINGTTVATLERGEYHEQIVATAAQITSTKPILVAQYSNGTSFDGVTSDPFMMLIPPFEQFLGSYTVATPASGFRVNYINVVAPTAGIGSIRVDGTVIPASSFMAIGSSGFSGAQIPVEAGTHNLTGGNFPFGAFVYGFDNADSYGYPGGQSLAPVATVRTITITLQGGSTATTGTEHCMLATATDQNNNPVAGVRVDFNITGANGQTGFATTGANGQARFCYTGTNPGTDNIVASSGTVSSTAQITWVTATKKSQTIAFGPLANKMVGDAPFTISATATSGLPVSFRIVSGPATISGNTITLTGMQGEVVVEASQAGNDEYAAAEPVIQRFMVTGNTTPVTCANTGGITYEMWSNVASRLVEIHHLPSGTAPTSTSTISSFSVPANVGDNYFARVRGYLCVPMTGNYRFHLSADDRAELWLSTDEDPANKMRVASLRTATAPGNYSTFPTQQSGTVMLEAGKRYYIEAVMREFRSKDHMTVAWTRPDGTMETIPGSSLVPFTGMPMACSGTGEITYEMWANVASRLVEIHHLPAGTAPSSTSTISSFSVPANVGDNYFARVRGYLCVPMTGNYRFHLSADDRAELWLSTDEDPANKMRVASLRTATATPPSPPSSRAR